MTRTPVLIVGAGPTGLVLALWLTRSGVSVRIIDAAAEPGTTSRALGVQARTLELYRQLGIAQEVVDAGNIVQAVNLWSGDSLRARIQFGNLSVGMSPFPYLLIYPQDEHEELLIRHLDALGVHVERNTKLAGFVQDADGVRATLTLPDGSESECDASYIAGCDGAHSKVRETLGIGFPGGTYAELFYVANVDASGPFDTREPYVSIDGADFVAIFPLRAEGRVRLIGRVREAPGDDPHAVTFADVSMNAIGRMHLVISKVNWFSTYKVHHRVVNSFRTGRAFLLGDAAHIHSPVGGQGMNTGIGDAINLAWKLAAVLKGEAAAPLLDSYEPERIGFARRLVATTDRAFTFVTNQTRVVSAVRVLLAAIILPFVVRTQAAKRFMFRTISQIGIKYPMSFLSVGQRRRRARRRSPAMGADGLSRQLHSAHLDGVAGAHLRRAALGGARDVRGAARTAAHLLVYARGRARGARALRAVSRAPQWLCRARRSRWECRGARRVSRRARHQPRGERTR